MLICPACGHAPFPDGPIRLHCACGRFMARSLNGPGQWVWSATLPTGERIHMHPAGYVLAYPADNPWFGVPFEQDGFDIEDVPGVVAASLVMSC